MTQSDVIELMKWIFDHGIYVLVAYVVVVWGIRQIILAFRASKA